MSYNGHGKISEAQREQLVRVFLSDGIRVAGPLAVSMGVARKYPAQLAATSGRRRTKRRTTNDADPRWAWAIERGPICV